MNDNRELIDRRRTLKLGKIKIHSPVRTLTVQDINAKRKLPTEIPLEAEIYVIHTKLNPSLIFSFDKNQSNSYFSKIIKALASTYGDLQGIHWLIPFYHFTKKEAIQLKESHLNKLINALILVTRNDADYTFDNILVESPFKNISLSERFFITIQKKLEKIGDINVIPVVDMNSPSFLHILNTLKNFGLNSIGIRYRSIQRHLIHYLDLMEQINRDENTSYFIVDVERYVPKTFRSIVQAFALPHLMPFLGFDIIVPKSTVSIYNPKLKLSWKNLKVNLRFMLREKTTVPLFSQMDQIERQHALNELEIDYYNDEELSIMKNIITNKDAEKIIERLIIDIKKNEYENNKNNIREKKEILLRIKALSKVQEPKASIKEILYFRQRKDPTDYLMERPNLERSLKTVYAFEKL